MHSKSSTKFVVGVDIGTTNIKCYIYDSLTNIKGTALERLPIQNFPDGRQEIVPNELWRVFQNVIKNCFLSACLMPSDIAALGISTQRGTFVTWDRTNGHTLHNFITWKDKRAVAACETWNSSTYIKLLRFGSYILSFFTENKKFQLFSNLHFSTSLVLIRLYWIFENKLQNKKLNENILFGTIETWLVWKLTGGKVHATDASNACATGLFDPFQMQWANWLLRLFRIPTTILPEVKNTCDSFGETEPEIFGSSIPIHSVIGDQQASLFGAGCFEKFDMNCTMGTGSFLCMNTGNTPCGAYNGLYPLVGWTISSKTTYIIEGGVHDVGTIISWAVNLGFMDKPENSEQIAESAFDNGKVYFLPGTNHDKSIKNANISTSSFIGLTTCTSKAQIVRSILEAIAFQVSELYNIIVSNYKTQKIALFRICGGVSENDFILQRIANITERNINKLENIECSSLGAAFLAGLYCGVWKDQEELKLLVKESKSFSPDNNLKRNQEEFKAWKNAYCDPIIAKQV